MKIPESWLREWVDPPIDTQSLAHELTMAGHEVDGIEIEGEALDQVVVAKVLEVSRHPNADRLKLCKVSSGGETVDVVCGAPNVREGMLSPLARPGAILPNGVRLRKAKIRGVASEGMLCSAAELGLGDDADGIIVLPSSAPVGEPLSRYLKLPDAVIDVDLTPNRGDCFSVVGIARDIAALTGAGMSPVNVPAVSAVIEDQYPVEIPAPELCPSFAGRVVRGIDSRARSPIWMIERLRRAGLRAIHPVVDVTNYVMLELGQPLHAYDLARVRGAIRPVLAKDGETVTLLDEKTVTLRGDTIVIADDSGAIGLAGIMGGLSTAVSRDTADVFFEAAFWPPSRIAGRARSYGLHTDASLRFERGVDPQGQARAVERATALLLEIAGGEAGVLTHLCDETLLPRRSELRLNRAALARHLGLEVPPDTVTEILERLGMDVNSDIDGWNVLPPGYRFDIAEEVDLIEEVARIHGYDRIPVTTAIADTPLAPATEMRVDPDRVADLLVARDYQEVITWSFVDAAGNRAFTGGESKLVLDNPISSEMSVMRASMWPGLVATAASNQARQQERLRLFEIGRTYHGGLDAPTELLRVAVLVCGPLLPEQWGAESTAADFFDLKSDVAAMLALAAPAATYTYEAATHPALQPGQAAAILRDGKPIGTLGKLHPRVAKTFDLKGAVYLAELDYEAAFASDAPKAEPVSRYPSIRRDLSFLIGEAVSADEIVAAARRAATGLVRAVKIFDVYRGPGIEAGLKSVALGLILQETSRTLTDADADAATAAVVRELQKQFAADLRD